MNLADLIYEAFAKEIRTWPAELTSDIYALSFYYDWHGEEYDEFSIILSYNTTTHLNGEIPRASGEPEAKWNFAFWLQEYKAWVGIQGDDADSDRVREIMKRHNVYLPASEIDALMDTDEERYVQFSHAQLDYIWSACASAAHRLHEAGIITAAFGKPIPIIVHELEYYDEVLDRTRQANPPGLTREFEAWVTGE